MIDRFAVRLVIGAAIIGAVMVIGTAIWKFAVGISRLEDALRQADTAEPVMFAVVAVVFLSGVFGCIAVMEIADRIARRYEDKEKGE